MRRSRAAPRRAAPDDGRRTSSTPWRASSSRYRRAYWRYAPSSVPVVMITRFGGGASRASPQPISASSATMPSTHQASARASMFSGRRNA
jgi:hypothetical protein